MTTSTFRRILVCGTLLSGGVARSGSEAAFAATPACDVDEDCGDHEFCSDAGKCVEAAEPLPVLFGDKKGGRVTGERARRGRDQVTFFGIDYSLARFIGNDDFQTSSRSPTTTLVRGTDSG